jgi:FkbM family methyltransferase
MILRVHRVGSHGQEVMCAVTTLSQLMRARGLTSIDLLKVDVEGEELSVLHGIDEAHWPHIAQASARTFTPGPSFARGGA